MMLIFKNEFNEVELIEIAHLLQYKETVSLQELFKELQSELLSVEVLDLILKLLVTDPNVRQSASQALTNLFFMKKPSEFAYNIQPWLDANNNKLT